MRLKMPTMLGNGAERSEVIRRRWRSRRRQRWEGSGVGFSSDQAVNFTAAPASESSGDTQAHTRFGCRIAGNGQLKGSWSGEWQRVLLDAGPAVPLGG
jgi:hypothetical protein